MGLAATEWCECICTRSVWKVSGLPLYLRAIVFERPLRGMNVNSKVSRTYRLLADICRTYSSCAACLCFFNAYLKRFKKRDDKSCRYCGSLVENAEHTLFVCARWGAEREGVGWVVGAQLTPDTRIKEWYNRFKGSRTFVDSDSRSGRPSTTKTLDNIERVRLVIESDRRLTVRELENDLGIPKTTVWEILNKILGMTRVCVVTGFFTTIARQRIHQILCSSF